MSRWRRAAVEFGRHKAVPPQGPHMPATSLASSWSKLGVDKRARKRPAALAAAAEGRAPTKLLRSEVESVCMALMLLKMVLTSSLGKELVAMSGMWTSKSALSAGTITV